MQKVLITIGLVLVAAGLLWPFLSKLSLGRLPGDIAIDRPGLKIFIPVTSMILVSVIISLILWILRR